MQRSSQNGYWEAGSVHPPKPMTQYVLHSQVLSAIDSHLVITQWTLISAQQQQQQQ